MTKLRSAGRHSLGHDDSTDHPCATRRITFASLRNRKWRQTFSRHAVDEPGRNNKLVLVRALAKEQQQQGPLTAIHERPAAGGIVAGAAVLT
jgi:hypothetical protein